MKDFNIAGDVKNFGLYPKSDEKVPKNLSREVAYSHTPHKNVPIFKFLLIDRGESIRGGQE